MEAAIDQSLYPPLWARERSEHSTQLPHEYAGKWVRSPVRSPTMRR